MKKILSFAVLVFASFAASAQVDLSTVQNPAVMKAMSNYGKGTSVKPFDPNSSVGQQKPIQTSQSQSNQSPFGQAQSGKGEMKLGATDTVSDVKFTKELTNEDLMLTIRERELRDEKWRQQEEALRTSEPPIVFSRKAN